MNVGIRRGVDVRRASRPLPSLTRTTTAAKPCDAYGAMGWEPVLPTLRVGLPAAPAAVREPLGCCTHRCTASSGKCPVLPVSV